MQNQWIAATLACRVLIGRHKAIGGCFGCGEKTTKIVFLFSIATVILLFHLLRYDVQRETKDCRPRECVPRYLNISFLLLFFFFENSFAVFIPWFSEYWNDASLQCPEPRMCPTLVNSIVTGFVPRLWVMTLWMIFAVDTQFKQLRKRSLKKKIQASAGFEPVTSAIPVQCSTNWAMKP